MIADVFGPTIKIEGRFEPDVRDNGLFAVGAGHVGVTSAGMEQYDAMARGIAAQVVSEEHRGTLIPCKPQSADGTRRCLCGALLREGRPSPVPPSLELR